MRLAAIPILAAWLCLSAAARGQTTFDRWGRVTEVKPVPVALGGYCVVSLRDQQQWQPGVDALSVVFDGLRYQFPTARNRDIFAAAPQPYGVFGCAGQDHDELVAAHAGHKIVLAAVLLEAMPH